LEGNMTAPENLILLIGITGVFIIIYVGFNKATDKMGEWWKKRSVKE
jgi:hypothetical protein